MRISELVSAAEILAQLAEEAAELSQAALKLRRTMIEENPTSTDRQDAIDQLNEELADVQVCATELGGLVSDEFIAETVKRKRARWLWRLKAKDVNADVIHNLKLYLSYVKNIDPGLWGSMEDEFDGMPGYTEEEGTYADIEMEQDLDRKGGLDQ